MFNIREPQLKSGRQLLLSKRNTPVINTPPPSKDSSLPWPFEHLWTSLNIFEQHNESIYANAKLKCKEWNQYSRHTFGPRLQEILRVPNVEVCLETLWILDTHFKSSRSAPGSGQGFIPGVQYHTVWLSKTDLGLGQMSRLLWDIYHRASSRCISILDKPHCLDVTRHIIWQNRRLAPSRLSGRTISRILSQHIVARLELLGTATRVPNLTLSNDSRNDQLQFLQANATKVGP